MSTDRLLDLLLEAATLKRMPRTGWAMRGASPVESVADHSHGVALVALVLVDALQPTAGPAAAGDAACARSGPSRSDVSAPDRTAPALDPAKVLAMAVLHDLAEVRLTDLPSSATRLLPDGVKRQAELSAIDDLLAPLSGAQRHLALWQEFEDATSPEGRLVRDADKLEMMIQCLRYEQAGCRGLDEFWAAMDRRAWHYPLCAELYAGLRARRPHREARPDGAE